MTTTTPLLDLARMRFDPPNPIWERTAPLLERWALSLPSSPSEHAHTICDHVERRFLPLWLEAHPEARFRAFAGPLREGIPKDQLVARLPGIRERLVSNYLFPDFVDGIPKPVGLSAISKTASNMWVTYGYEIQYILNVVYRQVIDARIVSESDEMRRLRYRSSEEWILVAEPSALAFLPPEIRDALDTPDGYAVAWDWISSQGDADGGTDDGLRLSRGVDAAGDPVPVWARRTALVRTVLRVMP